MFEFLFTVTAFYMAYVAYEAYQAVGRSEKGEPVFKPRPKPAPQPAAAKPAAVAPAAVKSEPKPAAAAPAPAKPAAGKAPAPAKPAAATNQRAAPAEPVKLADTLRNPATGETSPVPANYRFAKKWIKDALVSEKLLDRVYKPNELDDAASKKVKDAIDKLRAIQKYQA